MKKNKKNRMPQPPQPPKPVKLSGISRTGKKIILAGMGLLAVGYLVLTKTDPAGQNWASMLSPFLILGGYAVIGVGIIVPDKKLPLPQ